eukprot:4901497-Alexandrium_andersonii.AAC.1
MAVSAPRQDEEEKEKEEEEEAAPAKKDRPRNNVQQHLCNNAASRCTQFEAVFQQFVSTPQSAICNQKSAISCRPRLPPPNKNRFRRMPKALFGEAQGGGDPPERSRRKPLQTVTN